MPQWGYLDESPATNVKDALRRVACEFAAFLTMLQINYPCAGFDPDEHQPVQVDAAAKQRFAKCYKQMRT
jgi:hypothetical protein